MDLTDGQVLALSQLHDIIDASNGALSFRAEPVLFKDQSHLRCDLSLATRVYRTDAGFRFRHREPVQLLLPRRFPFEVPSLFFAHSRYIGEPHVQWGRYICLYQSSETEWSPKGGLYDFFERVDQWMIAAGKGELDADDAPLHPPVAYSTSDTTFVFPVDTPNVPKGGAPWIGEALLTQKRKGRFDVKEWRELGSGEPLGENEKIAAAILLGQDLPMEYPSTVDGLLGTLDAAGVTMDIIYPCLRDLAGPADRDANIHLIIGAPMRRKEAGGPIRQHLTAWEIDTDAVNALKDIIEEVTDQSDAIKAVAKWMVTAETLWCRKFEARPEVTNRRDVGTSINMLTGKRVLLLGCGALGSPIAEHIVRAGATELEIVDNGVVSPGILVRQSFADSDVGYSKSQQLARSLIALGLSTAITSKTYNLAPQLDEALADGSFDLIINATASASVAHSLESTLRNSSLTVPLISVSVSGAAQCGSVIVKMPEFPFGIIGIDRSSKIRFMKDKINHAAVRAFWPKPADRVPFQPEPGCSSPTFRASASDMSAHAGMLLNLAFRRIAELRRDAASCDLIPAVWTDHASDGALGSVFSGISVTREINHNYQVLETRIAKQDLANHVRQNARKISANVETGGLLFGEIDEAHRRIYVDGASGPPSDSVANETKFECGTKETREWNEKRKRQSGGSSRFIGLWHTHPVSQGRPSDEDLLAMAKLLRVQANPPRHVVMLIVGHSAARPTYSYYLFKRRDIMIVSTEEFEQLIGSVDA